MFVLRADSSVCYKWSLQIESNLKYMKIILFFRFWNILFEMINNASDKISTSKNILSSILLAFKWGKIYTYGKQINHIYTIKNFFLSSYTHTISLQMLLLLTISEMHSTFSLQEQA